MDRIIYYALSALAVLLILTIHEYSHAYAAYKLGDGTAKSCGRLSLNPIKHLDPVGALCMIIFRFGWARPVPINARNFRKPKRDFAICALAGPLSNLISAFFSAFLYLLLFRLFRGISFESEFTFNLAKNSLLFVSLFHSINIGIGIFNLIPVPPLDGSRILNVILPTKVYFGIMKHERNIYLGLLAWLLLGGYVKNALLSISFVAGSPVLSFIAGIFSLSDMIGSLIVLLSEAMLDFWQLIPFLKF